MDGNATDVVDVHRDGFWRRVTKGVLSWMDRSDLPESSPTDCPESRAASEEDESAHSMASGLEQGVATSDSADSTVSGPVAPVDSADEGATETRQTTTASAKFVEPVLDVRRRRYSLFPLRPRYRPLYDMYKDHVRCFWTVEEVDLSRDRADYEKLTPAEQQFVQKTFAFFAVSDGIVMENIAVNFFEEVVVPEARQFYAAQNFIESIHSEMYSLIIDTILTETADKDRLFHATRHHPSIRAKADWARRWMSPDKPFAQRLLAFACVEGIHFSSSFACLFWLKNKGVLPGATFSNELISRDEGLHRDFALKLYNLLDRPLSVSTVYSIVRSAVDVEVEFARDALSCPVLGIEMEQMQTYVEVVADHLLQTAGLPSLYKSVNPFHWMDMIGFDGKTNFFERRNGEYQKLQEPDGDIQFDAAF